MKKLSSLFVALLLLCSGVSYAQVLPSSPNGVKVDVVYVATEIQTEFPGGAAEMNRFLDQNIKHPNDAVKANVSGKVTLQFVVEKDGSIEHVKVLKGLGYGCDEEAIRLIKAMPKWSPAMQDGKPVRVYFNMPIKFNLSN